MTTDICKQCGEALEPGYALCWKCGTSLDGTAPAKDFVPDDTPAPPDAAPVRDLRCLRCDAPMSTISRLRLHKGTRAWPLLMGNLGELLVNRETFDAYACSCCGKVEFFVTR
jgi:hypothetical protein